MVELLAASVASSSQASSEAQIGETSSLSTTIGHVSTTEVSKHDHLSVFCVRALSKLLEAAGLDEASSAASALSEQLSRLHVARAAWRTTRARLAGCNSSNILEEVAALLLRERSLGETGFGVPKSMRMGTYLGGGTILSAFSSQSQAQLLERIVKEDETSLESMERLVVPLWANDADLNALTDRIVKALMLQMKGGMQMQAKEDLCALLLLAQGKKSQLKVVYGHILKNKKIEEFLGHDFSEQDWKDKAKKNAFRLLSQHRTILAAAFFLLGGSIQDAVGVLQERTHEPYLGMWIARVNGGDSAPEFKNSIEALQEAEGGSQDPRHEILQICNYWIERKMPEAPRPKGAMEEAYGYFCNGSSFLALQATSRHLSLPGSEDYDHKLSFIRASILASLLLPHFWGTYGDSFDQEESRSRITSGIQDLTLTLTLTLIGSHQVYRTVSNLQMRQMCR